MSPVAFQEILSRLCYTTSPRHPTGLGQEHRQQQLLSIMTSVLYNTTGFLRILLSNNANRRKLPVKGEASKCNLPIGQATVRFQSLDPAAGYD